MAYSLLKKKGFNVVNINGGYSGMLKNGLKLIKKIIPKWKLIILYLKNVYKNLLFFFLIISYFLYHLFNLIHLNNLLINLLINNFNFFHFQYLPFDNN